MRLRSRNRGARRRGYGAVPVPRRPLIRGRRCASLHRVQRSPAEEQCRTRSLRNARLGTDRTRAMRGGAGTGWRALERRTDGAVGRGGGEAAGALIATAARLHRLRERKTGGAEEDDGFGGPVGLLDRDAAHGKSRRPVCCCRLRISTRSSFSVGDTPV